MQKLINRILNLFNRPRSQRRFGDQPGVGKSYLLWQICQREGLRYQTQKLIAVNPDDMRLK